MAYPPKVQRQVPPKVQRAVDPAVQARQRELELARREYAVSMRGVKPVGYDTMPEQWRRRHDRKQRRLPTPEKAAIHARLAGRPELDTEYYESRMSPVVAAPRVEARKSARLAQGMQTEYEKNIYDANQARLDRESDLALEQERSLGKTGVASIMGASEENVADRQGRADENVADTTGRFGLQKAIAEIKARLDEEARRKDTPEERIKEIAAEQGAYDAGRNQAMQSAGVIDLNDLLEPMESVAREGGSPGAFGVFGVKGDMSRAESVVLAYKRLVSDPLYGNEFKAWFESRPRFAQFKKKIASWGMSLDDMPPVSQEGAL